MPDDQETKSKERRDGLKVLAGALALIVAVGSGMVYILLVWVLTTQFEGWVPMVTNHFPAIVGLPGAAAVSFSLVVFLRQAEGPMELEAPGFKLKGAAGQVFMWAVCFLAIALAIKLLWNA